MIIPEKFKCDVEGCEKTPVTANEAASFLWYVVAYSPDPRYVAINPWATRWRIPDKLTKWHACSFKHAIELLEAAAVNL
jgi:hypothetical protein